MYRRSYAGMMAAVVASFAALAITIPTRGIEPPPSPTVERTASKRRRRRVAILSGRASPGLNRSRHWRYARTYQEARLLSPYPWMSVR